MFSVIIIGLGKIGMGYDLHLDPDSYVYSHVRAFSQHKDFNLIAGVDTSEMNRHIFENNYHCPTYADIGEALFCHHPDIVIIAVPTQLHGKILQRVLSLTQPKVILCEKPLSYDLHEAQFMVKACADRGVRLYVNYMRRSDPGAIEIKRRIDNGAIITPLKGVAWYSKGFLHNGSHFFNLIEYWLGPMTHAEVLEPGRLLTGDDSEPDVRIVFTNGIIIFIAAKEENFSHYTIELLSSNGRLRYEQGGNRIEWQPATSDPCFNGYTVLSSEPVIIPTGMDRYQWHVANQLSCVLHGGDAFLCSGDDALITLAKMRRIIERNEISE